MAIGVALGAAVGRTGEPPRISDRAGRLPPLVFVSRNPVPGEPGAVPGLGPRHRAVATGGRLLVRESKGAIRSLLPDGAFFDVADPAVSYDGKRIAFAAVVSPDSAWRLWLVGADGRGLASITRTTPDAARADDLDPCWLPDGRIVFASTRFAQRAQAADVPVTNLFVVHADGSGRMRITSERNGADEPGIDPASGRIVYGRWLFNRYLPSDVEPHGITLERGAAVPQDTIDIWQAVSVVPDGDGIRLAGGDARAHARMMCYQPVLLRDSLLVGVGGAPGSLQPAPQSLGLQAFPKCFAAPRQLTGPGTGFPGPACSPAPLHEKEILFSGDPRAPEPGSPGVDLGLYRMQSDGSHPARVLDLPGTLELDAAVLAPRRVPPVLLGACDLPAPDRPLTRPEELADSSYTFRFDCLNVFATGPVDSPFPDAPPLQRDLRIRFFGTVARPDAAGGDSLVLIREMPVDPSGAVHVDDIRADTPLFEQLVDAQGRVVRSTRGPAHVPGYNFARLGAGTKCIGCHAGHSALPVPANNWRAKWFNASPSARVTASAASLGSGQALVDRRRAGSLEEVGWAAAADPDPWVRLDWQTAIEVRGLVLYPVGARENVASRAFSSLQVRETEIVFWRGGQILKRLRLDRSLDPRGSRVECDPVRVDGLEIRLRCAPGRARNGAVVALREIETVARIVED